MEKVWTYVLPLPIESMEQLKLLLSVFNSEVTINILKNIKLEGKTYQKTLMEKLPYSSKTIVLKLKQLVSVGVLEEGLEKRRYKNRNVWVKWYVPTFIGKWIITLLTPLESMDLKELKKLTKDLYKIYVKNLIELSLNLNFQIEDFQKIFDEIYIRKVSEFSRKSIEPVDVIVFGTIHLNHIVEIENFSLNKSFQKIKQYMIEKGGSSANIAIILNKLGVKTAFSGKCAEDGDAKDSISTLLKEKVMLSHLIVEENLKTPHAFFLSSKSYKTMLIPKKEELLIKSPSEIDWSLIDNCKIIFIGEMGKEIAEIVASYSKARNKTVIYRAPPYLNLKDLELILRNTNIFIIDVYNLKIPELDLEEIASLTENTIVLKWHEKIIELYSGGEISKMEIPFEIRNFEYCSDVFIAGLIKGLLLNFDLKKSISYGVKLIEKNSEKLGIIG